MPGDHVEVLREGTVGGKARTLLAANHMPRAVEVAGQYARVRSPRRARGSRRGSGACQSDAGCDDLHEEQDQETDRATDPWNREPVHDLRNGEE